MKKIKTNAMRQLEDAGISFETVTYSCDEFESGNKVASLTGIPEHLAFKTLVTKSKEGVFVFSIPVNHELDLKKAAKAVGVKKLEMLHVKELLPLTGYVRGGVSPIGMKKVFPVFIQREAQDEPFIYLSGGKQGVQLKLCAKDLEGIVPLAFEDVVKE